MKISSKITIAYLILFITVLSLIGIIFANFYFSHTKDQLFSYLYSSSRARAEHVRSYINEQKKTGKMLAAASVYRDYLLEPSTSSQYTVIKDKIIKRLNRTLQTDEHISRVSILDKNGVVVASTYSKIEKTNQSNELFFIKGAKETSFQDVFISPFDNKSHYRISSPITNDDGSLLGVSTIEYNTSEFFSIVSNENGFGTTEENFIINHDKYLLTPSLYLSETAILKTQINTVNATLCFDPKEINYIKKNGYTKLKDYLGTKALIEAKDYRNTHVIGTHLYIPETDWCLITKVDQSDFYKSVYDIFYILLFIIGISVVIFAIIARTLAENIVKPIKKLQQSAEKIEQGDFNYPIDTTSHNEIGLLSKSIESMTRKLSEANKNIEMKVAEQTKEINEQKKDLVEQRMALLNVLEDVEKEQKTAEQNAHDLRKFQLAVEKASDHIVITNPDGEVLYANHAVEEITGFPLSDVVGQKAGAKTLWGGLMELSFYQKLWETIKINKLIFSGEITNKRKNGDHYVAEVHISPVLNKQNEVIFFVGIERDITKAKEVDRMKTEFISLASHQLRTPLSAMKWFLEMLLHGDAGTLTQEQTEFIDNINQSNDRMIDLVNSLLNVSRIESGRIIIDPKPTNIHQLIQNVIDELSIKVKAKHLSLITNINKEIPIVNIDEKLIRQIYINLLTNAIRYSPENNEILIVVSKDEKEIVTQITDNGYGIPEKEQDRIFNKFFRATNAIKKVTDGNGLGLYLVKSIVESSGGRIWFKSEENKGSSFFFTIPLAGSKEKKGEVTISG